MEPSIARRVAALALVLAASLAWVGAALATPSLVVEGSTTALGRPVEATIALEDGDATGARVAIVVPAGYGLDLGQLPGTVLGSATARLRTDAGDLAVDGPLLVGDPAATTSCGTGGHAAVWRLALQGGGAVVDVEAGVDPSTSGYRVELCVPDGLRGARVASLSLSLTRGLVNPGAVGTYPWRALIAPLGPDGTPAPELEVRSVLPLPVALTLAGSFSRANGTASLNGVVRAGGRPVAGARVTLVAGSSLGKLNPIGIVTTDAAGRFRASRPIDGSTVFRAGVVGSVRPSADGCADPVAPAGCAGETIVVGPASSGAVRIAVPRSPALRLGSRGADVRRLQESLIRLHYLPPGQASGAFDERTWHAVVAFQGWQQKARTGVVDRSTWTLLSAAGAPRPWGGLRTGVQVDTLRQVLFLVRDGRVVRVIHVSTGAYGRTPRGQFSVRSKEIHSWSRPFKVWLPYAQYFSGGFALHAYPSVPSYAASHGCIRLPYVEAPIVWAFTSVGMPVWVR